MCVYRYSPQLGSSTTSPCTSPFEAVFAAACERALLGHDAANLADDADFCLIFLGFLFFVSPYTPTHQGPYVQGLTQQLGQAWASHLIVWQL